MAPHSDIMAQNKNFPLHAACKNKSLESLRSLLEELNNNVTQTYLLLQEDDQFWTAAHFAAYSGWVSTSLQVFFCNF